MDLEPLLALLPSYLLHLVRAGSFFVGIPLFGAQRTSRMLRLMLAFSVGSVFWWVGPKTLEFDGTLAVFGGLVVREAVIGFAAGFAVRVMIAMMSTAGEMISHEMGFGMARAVDPVTGRNSPVVAQLFEIMALLLIFELNLHHDVIHVLGSAYQALPVGEGFDTALVHERLRELIGASLHFAARYAVPIVAVMALLTATLVILARAVPNINLLEFSFGLRSLLALLASVYFLSEGMPFLEDAFTAMLQRAGDLFTGT